MLCKGANELPIVLCKGANELAYDVVLTRIGDNDRQEMVIKSICCSPLMKMTRG